MQSNDNQSFQSDEKAGSYRTVQEFEEREVDLRLYALAILNRRWMILTLAVIVVVSTAIYSLLQTPVYRSKAVVDLSPPPTYIVLPDASQTLYSRNDSFLNTQYRLLKGKALAIRVAENLALSESDLKGRSFNGKGRLGSGNNAEELSDAATILLKMVQIVPIPETNICEIIFTTPDPKLSMTVANTWAQEYAANRLDSMQQYTRTTEQLLMDQVKSLQTEIAESEKALHEYSLEKDIVKLDKNRSMANVKLTEINTDLNLATKDRMDAEIRYQAMRATSKEMIPEVQQNQLVQHARSEIAKLEQDYAAKSRLYKPDYPEMLRLRAQMDLEQKNLQSAFGQGYQEVLGSARSAYQEAALKESTLKKRMDEVRKESAESGRKELDYDQLAMEIENKKQLLVVLLQKQNATDVSAQVQEKAVPTTRIIEYAELPKKVFSPDIQKNLLFAILAGLLGSIGLALLLDYFDRSLKTAEDVEQQLHLPYLGMVPFYVMEGENGHGNSSKALAKLETPQASLARRYGPYRLSVLDTASPASEAIKTVRTSLLLAFPGSPPRSILITSSRAGEGKTFIACNLAVALTQLDKRVVIVDADMRNPNLHKAWDVQNDMGLSIYLSNDVPIASVLKTAAVSRLTLMTSGPKTPRPAELLASARFGDLLKQLEGQFDFVIVDSPPVLPVADSVILASHVQSVILVVRGGTTPRDVVKMAKRKLAASNGIIAGTVLNGIDLADPYYYYRYYSDYYAHYYGGTQLPPDKGNGTEPSGKNVSES